MTVNLFMLKWNNFLKIIFVTLLISNFAQASPLNIIVTVPYISDLVHNVTCNSSKYNVDSLIPVGVDPHTYILTPNDRIRIKNANLIIQIGAGLEHWLDKIPFEKGQNRIVFSQHLNFHKMLDTESKNTNELVFDPHIWQSPKLTEEAALLLSQFLALQNPTDKNSLESCTKKYIEKIHSTVAELKKQVATIPEKNKLLATNHDALGYFADAFGFKIFSILGLSDEDEPSVEQLQSLITLLLQQHIKSVFLESTGNTKNIQTVANNAHVEVGGKLYGDSFGEKGSGADTTISMWQANTATLVKALK